MRVFKQIPKSGIIRQAKNQEKYAKSCFVLKNDCSEAWQTATVRKVQLVWATLTAKGLVRLSPLTYNSDV